MFGSQVTWLGCRGLWDPSVGHRAAQPPSSPPPKGPVGQPHANDNSPSCWASFCAGRPLLLWSMLSLREVVRPAQGHTAGKRRAAAESGLAWGPTGAPRCLPAPAGLPEAPPPRGPCSARSRVRPRRRQPPGAWCGAPASAARSAAARRLGTGPGRPPPRSGAAASGPRWWPSWA